MVVLDPVPAYVVKTTDTIKGSKVFINVCTDPQISAPETLDAGEIALQVTRGADWTVPIVVSVGRQDVDKKGSPSYVVDCCMNPQVVLLGIEDPSVKILTVETCIESVEDRHQLVLSRDYKFPRMKVKNQLVKTEFDPDQPKKLNKNTRSSEESEMLVDDTEAVSSVPETKPAKPAEIEILDSDETVYYLHMYRGPYSGPLPRPSHVVELDGEQREVQLIGKKLILGANELSLPFLPTQHRGFYSDGTTYIMLWKP